MSNDPIRSLSRRRFMGLGAAGAGAAWLGLSGCAGGARRRAAAAGPGDDFRLEEATLADLQAAMTAGALSAAGLVAAYLERIREVDGRLNSILQVNPDAEALAEALDRERAARGPRGPLHGVPILLKDNIDTADGMETTAGSLALLGVRRARDAFVAERLRQAGAVLLGKANLSEWANFRSTRSSSGWSARGGQGRNPYVLDRSPCGSSSGSAQAVSANLAAAALGTETDGSIVCPAAVCGLVGIKPTLGLTSRAGVIPLAHSQDVVGPMARTVADAAAVLSAIAGTDPRDPATAAADRAPVDYTAFLDPGALRGARIGVMRETFFGYSPQADAVAEDAIALLRHEGAEVVDPADLPSARALQEGEDELEVLLYEFKADLDAYLGALGHPDVPRTLAELIAFNEAHARQEMPWFGQELFLSAQEKGPLTEPAYLEALARSKRLAREEGLDAALAKHRLDALVAPTGGPAWTIDLVNGDHYLGSSSTPAAVAGYPAITVPAGQAHGLPLGLSFIGTAFSEPRLVALAYAFEQASRARRPPRLLPSLSPEAPAERRMVEIPGARTMLLADEG